MIRSRGGACRRRGDTIDIGNGSKTCPRGPTARAPTTRSYEGRQQGHHTFIQGSTARAPHVHTRAYSKGTIRSYEGRQQGHAHVLVHEETVSKSVSRYMHCFDSLCTAKTVAMVVWRRGQYGEPTASSRTATVAMILFCLTRACVAVGGYGCKFL